MITVLLLFVSNIFMMLTLSFETERAFHSRSLPDATLIRSLTKRQALPPMHRHGARVGLYGFTREAIPATSFGRG
jgi:hypothetical protein